MENAAWRMQCGECSVENAVWRIQCGECSVENAVWGWGAPRLKLTGTAN